MKGFSCRARTLLRGAALGWMLGVGVAAGAKQPITGVGQVSGGLYALPAPTGGVERGVRFSIESPFRPPIHSGWAPIRVSVRNDSGRAGTWNLRFVSECGRVHVVSQFSAQAAAGDTRRLDLSVPLCASAGAWSTTRLRLEAVGTGLPHESTQLWWHHIQLEEPAKRPTEFIGMSERLAVTLWEPLAAELRARHALELTGTRLALTDLPRDWRDYEGFGAIWLAADEWADLPAAGREGLREWVASGGRLFVVVAPGNGGAAGAQDDVPPEQLGFGGIIPVAGAVDASLLPVLIATVAAEERRYDTVRGRKWGLLEVFVEAAVPATLLLLFVSAYALVVGPLNLFFCSRVKKRRPLALYWSTPVIAAGASLLVLLIILLKDGLGGDGERQLVTMLLPDQRIAVVHQEQVSRTGLLLGSSFELREPVALVRPVENPTEVWRSQMRLGWERQQLSGDWFQSRARQTHVLGAVRPTRARVARLAAGADEAHVSLLSSLSEEMRTLYYRDGRGRCWKGQRVATGRRAELERTSCDELLGFWSRAAAGYSPAAFWHLDAQKQRRAFFYAELAGDQGAIATHDAIRWRRTTHIALGPVVEQE